MTGRQGSRISAVWFDEVRAFDAAELQAALDAALDARRSRLIAEVYQRYGVTLHPHPRLGHVVVTSVSQWDTLRDAVGTDPGLDALGRGYYLGLGLGGEVDVQVAPDCTCDLLRVDVQVAPDWTCDPLRVSLLRVVVVTTYRPLSRLCRALSCLLALHTPGSCKPNPKEYR
ncbi:hypothetical protein A9Z40_03070 [Microbacterium arborescens]|uniref:Uncharacterized protein n=1 Tax=Microbacterium arborescens TaxID=33883 RepID=A0ABX2WIS1_9MICO|nr:hypothetical protein [Microbacterium arborescens]OAZ40937.1 hypothetical protein A9Z40_03070 [Microbacterium arborescens]